MFLRKLQGLRAHRKTNDVAQEMFENRKLIIKCRHRQSRIRGNENHKLIRKIRHRQSRLCEISGM